MYALKKKTVTPRKHENGKLRHPRYFRFIFRPLNNAFADLESIPDLRECGPADALAEAHEVPRPRPDEDGVRLVGERGLHVEDELDVVDS